MITNTTHNSFFSEIIEPLTHTNVIGSPLTDTIDWIQKKLKPEDVFTQKQLEEWAEENGVYFPDDK